MNQPRYEVKQTVVLTYNVNADSPSDAADQVFEMIQAEFQLSRSDILEDGVQVWDNINEQPCDIYEDQDQFQ